MPKVSQDSCVLVTEEWLRRVFAIGAAGGPVVGCSSVGYHVKGQDPGSLADRKRLGYGYTLTC